MSVLTELNGLRAMLSAGPKSHGQHRHPGRVEHLPRQVAQKRTQTPGTALSDLAEPISRCLTHQSAGSPRLPKVRQSAGCGPLEAMTCLLEFARPRAARFGHPSGGGAPSRLKQAQQE